MVVRTLVAAVVITMMTARTLSALKFASNCISSGLSGSSRTLIPSRAFGTRRYGFDDDSNRSGSRNKSYPRSPSRPFPRKQGQGRFGGGADGDESGSSVFEDRFQGQRERNNNDYRGPPRGGGGRGGGMRNRDRDFSRGGGGAPDRQQDGSGEYQRSSYRDRDFRGEGGGGERAAAGGGGGGGGGGRMRIDYRDNNANDAPREKPYGDYDGDHLYGVSPVKAALMSDRRKVEELLVQEGMNLATKKDSKGVADILALAKKRGIPIREFPKHDLNMLSDNRPHQGFILRASPLRFRRLEGSQALAAQPHGSAAAAAAGGEEGSPTTTSSTRHKVVLVLDEVWDPQNFGALLRTAHFLPGVAEVVVCAKNSAPLSETVSKASAGAMESVEVYSVDNMMKFLDNSVKEGWYVVGTSLGSDSMLMQDVPRDRPTILVLGNEGHGIRTNVLRRCTHLVRIDGGSGEGEGVDSLNVSVTGGIMLHHLSSSSEHAT